MSLRKKIIALVEAKHFITFRRYMELCLFDEEKGGYYTKNLAVGKDGDFVTSPEISQLFGEMIALYFIHTIKTNYSGQKIQIIELGAGKGTLMSDILRVIEKFPEIYKNIDCAIVEVNKTLIEHQKNRLSSHSGKISWYRDFTQVPKKKSIIYANEFFDALPVAQYKYISGNWNEIVVKLNASDELYLDTEITESSNSIKATPNNPNDGAILEINQDSVAIMQQISRFLAEKNGLFLTFDYGYLEQQYTDTVQSLYRHEYNNIFENIGDADLTSYVDFGALVKSVQNQGLKNIYFNTQAEFLRSLGIEERAKNLKGDKAKISEELDRLIGKNQMGEIFKCLLVENL